MAGSVNKVILIGNLGNDPEIRSMQSGNRVANLSIATGESWKDKATGERREKTEWHRVVVFNEGLITIIERYLKKGSKVYLEGQLETRSWEQDGVKKYTTEVVLKNFNGVLTMLDSKGGDSGYSAPSGGSNFNAPQQPMAATGTDAGIAPSMDGLDDDIPF